MIGIKKMEKILHTSILMKSITSRNNAFRIRKRKKLMKSHQNPIIDRFCRLEGVDKENSLGTNSGG